MAAIDDLIAQIDDAALRVRLKEEADRLRRDKKFGLVFEEHLPELTPIYDAEIRRGVLVAKRGAAINQVWRVLQVEDGKAHCLDRASGEREWLPLAELVMVLEFGQPIYPALTSLGRVENGPADAPWHTLIEADNYHALQLLEYIYAGQVDCIYIDPPYNKGARDWKYNNDYVDSNDRWRHSKWLAMMRRRLVLAKRLLKPDTGVIIVTVDENELHHLGMLMQSVFSDAYQQLVTIVITSKGVAKQGLGRVEEYAVYAYLGNSSATLTNDDLLTHDPSQGTKTPWASLLRRGTNAAPSDRPGLVYPILVDPDSGAIKGVGETLAERVARGEFNKDELNRWNPTRSKSEAWPIRSDGSLGTWQVKPTKLMDLNKSGFVKLGRFDGARISWAVNYLKRGPIKAIEQGDLIVKGYEWEGGPAILEYLDDSKNSRRAKTVWYRTMHDAGTYGSNLLRSILGTRLFDFPKSLYAVRDTLSTVVADNRTAIIVDFFAGSGTTLHAVDLLNLSDSGRRRCILVTNNEVSEDVAVALSASGHYPGDREWEEQGICRSITWPRCKYAITGHRDDGSTLQGEYLTTVFATKERDRSFRQLSFADPATLTTARKKDIVSLIDAIPTGEIKSGTVYYISADESRTAAILFDDTQADAFVEALDGMDHITHFYIVTQSNKRFQELKERIEDLLGPIEVQEEEKRPMQDGFPANLEYFKLHFLDKDRVALGRQFREILPLLWLRAGAVGARPVLPDDEPVPSMLIPPGSPFAVLVDETCFADFQAALSKRSDITHVYLVTDSVEAYQEMAAEMAAPHVIQLYRDYLENFAINRRAVA